MSIHSQDIEKSQHLKSIKGSNSVANLGKMMLYSPNADLFNANVYTKFDYILSIHSQDMEKKTQILTPVKGCFYVKMRLYNSNIHRSRQ